MIHSTLEHSITFGFQCSNFKGILSIKAVLMERNFKVSSSIFRRRNYKSAVCDFILLPSLNNNALLLIFKDLWQSLFLSVTSTKRNCVDNCVDALLVG